MEAEWEADFDPSLLSKNAPDVCEPNTPSCSETELESPTPVKKKSKRRRVKAATPSSSEPKSKGPKGGSKPLRKPSSAQIETALQEPGLHVSKAKPNLNVCNFRLC